MYILQAAPLGALTRKEVKATEEAEVKALMLGFARVMPEEEQVSKV